ncbi:MAG: hypothetical protein U0163_20005 [Gemmatimonadaceae bacterium]
MTIRFGADVVASGIPVGADGTFVVTLSLLQPRGLLRVTGDSRMAND